MARIFQTGWEMGSNSIMDIQSGGGSSVGTSPVGGSWSTYSHTGGTGATPSSRSIPASSEIYFGFRFYSGDISGWSNGGRVVGFGSPSFEQIYIGEQLGGKLRAYRADGTNLGSGTLQFTANTWYYIEAHVVISDSVGVFEIKINGTQDINVTGADTRTDPATANLDRVYFTSGNSKQYDDFYVNDTSGSQNTGYSGDIRISSYIPNAAGDVTGLTRGGTDSGNNYGQVDERPPNDATDYVFGTDTTSYDLYNIPNTSGVATVQAVSLWVRAQKSDASAANIAHKIKSGSTEDTGSDIALSTSWTYYHKLYNNDPTDSTAWSASKVDSLQIGAKSR